MLEGATVLTACKVACSLSFLRSVSSYSPVSLCSCCLLVFTDVILTVFFSVLLVLDRWQIEMPSTGDTIALRSLIFISHTYGAVFLLTLPAVIVDTFIQSLQSQHTSHQQTPTLKDETKSTDKHEKKPFLGYHVVAYFCCLSLWTFGTLGIRWRWKLEEVCAVACLYSSNSLLACLPNIYSPTVRFLHPGWIIASLCIALAIILSIILSRKSTVMHLKSPDIDTVSYQNSCKVQVFAERDVELLQEADNRTEKVISLTLAEERQSVGAQSGNARVFPCLGADVMIGVVCVLALFVLPLNLSVNIHLISAVEKVLQWSIQYFGLLKNVTPYTDTDMDVI